MDINAYREEYIDKRSQILHTVRQNSSYFKEHQDLIPPEWRMFANLCKAIITYGRIDGERAPGQYRVNIGCGGQDFRTGFPAKLIGKKFAS